MADDDIKTILHAVCRYKRNDLLKLLLERGVDCTVTDSGSWHFACMHSSSLLTHELLIAGQTAYEFAMEAKNIQGAIAIARKTLELHPEGHSSRSRSLANLANALLETMAPSNYREAIHLLRQALALLPPNHTDTPSLNGNLINALQRTASSVYSRNQLIALRREVLQLSPPGSPSRLGALDDLASALLRKGTLGSIQDSYPLIQEALSLRPPEDHRDLRSLQGLAGSLRGLVDTVRSKGSVSRLQEIEESIPLIREALSLLPAGHSSRGHILQSLAISLQDTGSIDNMHEVIILQREVLQLCPTGHTDRGFALNALAYSLALMYDVAGDLPDLIEAITHATEAIALWSVHHRYHRYALVNLAMPLHFLPDRRDESLALIKKAAPFWPSSNSDGAPFDISRALAPIFFFYYEETGSLEHLREAAAWCERSLALCSPSHCCRYKLVALKAKIDLHLPAVPSP